MCRVIFVPILLVFAFSTDALDLTVEERAAIESRIRPAGNVCLLGQNDCVTDQSGAAVPASVSNSSSSPPSAVSRSNASVKLVDGGCNLTIEAGDSLQFSLRSMTLPASCGEISVTLNHTGNMPASAMGHNWVLTQDEDSASVASDGANAGIDNDYVPTNDSRVVAYTKLIGGGQSATVSFSSGKLDPSREYTFFCSFPGHSFVMRGTFKLK